jgi:hypothetical protein
MSAEKRNWMIKPFLRTVQAGALATLAAVIGMIVNLTSIVQLIPITLVIVAALGLIYMTDWLLASIERIEKQEELERQYERDKVHLETLQELRELNQKQPDPLRNVWNTSNESSRQRELIAAINRLNRNLETPDAQRLITPENEQAEDISEDIPPEAGSTESKS